MILFYFFVKRGNSMPLVPAKCTNCGATLQVDDSRHQFICRYCGSSFLVEKAIANYITTNNVTNNIHAEVINVYRDSIDDFEIVGGRLVKYRGKSTTVSIPSSVIAIADDAFKESAVESVVIPGSVRTVSGFYESEFLNSVTFENGIREIGSFAFCKCKNLNSISLPSSVTKISDKAFYECSSLQTVILSNGLKEIGDSAFSYCKKLTSIDIPESTTQIGHLAFSFCDNLMDITIRGDIENLHYDIDYSGKTNAYEYPFESDYKLFDLYKSEKANGGNYQRFVPRVITSESNLYLFEHSQWKRIKDYEESLNTVVTDKSSPIRSDIKDDFDQSKAKETKSFFKRLKEPVESLEEAKEIKKENTRYLLIFLTVFLVSGLVMGVLDLLNKFPIIRGIFYLFAALGMIGTLVFCVTGYLIRTVMKKMKDLSCNKCGSKLRNDENTTWKEVSHRWIDNNEYSSTLWVTLQISCTCPNCKAPKTFAVNLSSGGINITDHSIGSTVTTTQSIVDDYFNGIIHK